MFDVIYRSLVGLLPEFLKHPQCPVGFLGKWKLEQPTLNDEKQWEEFSWYSSSNIQSVFDTTDDAAAQSEYEAELARIQKRDKTLELRLEQIQTEEQAVEKELESAKNIIGDNIKNSFSTFKA